MNENNSKLDDKVHQQILSKVPFSNEIKNLHLQNKLYTLENVHNINEISILNENSSLKRNFTEPIYNSSLETKETINFPTPQNNTKVYSKNENHRNNEKIKETIEQNFDNQMNIRENDENSENSVKEINDEKIGKAIFEDMINYSNSFFILHEANKNLKIENENLKNKIKNQNNLIKEFENIFEECKIKFNKLQNNPNIEKINKIKEILNLSNEDNIYDKIIENLNYNKNNNNLLKNENEILKNQKNDFLNKYYNLEKYTKNIENNLNEKRINELYNDNKESELFREINFLRNCLYNKEEENKCLKLKINELENNIQSLNYYIHCNKYNNNNNNICFNGNN